MGTCTGRESVKVLKWKEFFTPLLTITHTGSPHLEAGARRHLQAGYVLVLCGQNKAGTSISAGSAALGEGSLVPGGHSEMQHKDMMPHEAHKS